MQSYHSSTPLLSFAGKLSVPSHVSRRPPLAPLSQDIETKRGGSGGMVSKFL